MKVIPHVRPSLKKFFLGNFNHQINLIDILIFFESWNAMKFVYPKKYIKTIENGVCFLFGFYYVDVRTIQ